MFYVWWVWDEVWIGCSWEDIRKQDKPPYRANRLRIRMIIYTFNIDNGEEVDEKSIF